MLGLTLALASGFLHAVYSAVAKQTLKDTTPYIVAFATNAFAIPFYLFALLWLDLTPVNATFWGATFASAFLNVGANLIMLHALKIGELSTTVPFLSFTPLFLILTSRLMVKELPSTLGILGITAIVAGAYLLELRAAKGLLGPFKAVARNRGSRLVLLVAFMWSITSNFDKIAVRNSNPITYNLVFMIVMASLFALLIAAKPDQKFGAITSKFSVLAVIGALVALGALCQMTAISLGLVAYVISLKRTNGFWSVVLGVVFFKEGNVVPRLAGSLLMIAGVVLISLGQ